MRILLAAVAAAMLLNAAPRTRGGLLVSPKWLHDRLNNPAVVVLDVERSRSEYEKGHIPGARLLLLSEIVSEHAGVANELPPAADLQRVFEQLGVSDRTEVVLYGDTLAATRAFFTLDYLGHAHTALLDGSVERWRAERLPLTTEPPKVSPGVLVPKPRPEIVMSLDGMRDLSYEAARFPGADVALIDVRSPEVSAKGRIPGSKNVYWMAGLRSKQDPSLKSAAELRKLYRLPDNPRVVVTYCNSGVQASQGYFTLRYLGYLNVRMYDGSFSEWSRNPELPIQH